MKKNKQKPSLMYATFCLDNIDFVFCEKKSFSDGHPMKDYRRNFFKILLYI